MKTPMIINQSLIVCLLFSLILSFTGIPSLTSARENQINPISKAYLKELSFLKAQKKALQQRVSRYQKSSQKRLNQAQLDLEKFEKDLLSFQRRALQLEDELHQVEKQETELDQLDGAYDLFAQASQVLDSVGLSLTLLKTEPSIEEIKQALQNLNQVSLQALTQGTQIRRKKGAFFNQKGIEAEGDVIEIGRVARIAKPDPNSSSPSSFDFVSLAPAGKGHFKVWPLSKEEDLFDSQGLLQNAFAGQSPTLLPVVLYENQDLSLEKKVEKTWEDELKAGGSVGAVIVILGIIAFFFALWRMINLFILGRSFNDKRVQYIFNTLNSSSVPQSSSESSLQDLAKTLKSSRMIFRILKGTLLGIDKGGRTLGEEYGFEQLLKEQNRLERFGTLIMVSASIAPLLGLLGTVSGMIATFDVITEFGTGDPRLLSGGISEALVTTRLGLIVAIPTLFLGTLLNGQSHRLAGKAQIKMLELLNTWDEAQSQNTNTPNSSSDSQSNSNLTPDQRSQSQTETTLHQSGHLQGAPV